MPDIRVRAHYIAKAGPAQAVGSPTKAILLATIAAWHQYAISIAACNTAFQLWNACNCWLVIEALMEPPMGNSPKPAFGMPSALTSAATDAPASTYRTPCSLNSGVYFACRPWAHNRT